MMSIKKYKGLCVSPGKVKGTVLNYYSNNHDEVKDNKTIVVIKKLERDVILNLDPNVIGVVAEIGNIGSHGAGILRQLRIPCILRIPNATKLFEDGETIEIDGETNAVIAYSKQNEDEEPDAACTNSIRYSEVATDKYDYSDIRTNNFWFKPRPDRIYQRLRYDMIADVYTKGTSYLYCIDSQTRHASDGTIEIFGVPTIESICVFQLCNPSWFVEKAKERSVLFRSMKDELHEIAKTADSNNIGCVINVYRKAISQYKRLFKYMFLTQFHSDSFIEFYLDFIENLTGKRTTADVLALKSSYVMNCIQTKNDPGVFRKWDNSLGELYVWEGEIDYTPFQTDEAILSCISNRMENSARMLRDYNSFRTLVPLIYQLSEEFFYMSKSINTFLNWSMQILFTYLNDALNLNFESINNFYDLSLVTINNYISQIQGGKEHDV